MPAAAKARQLPAGKASALKSVPKPALAANAAQRAKPLGKLEAMLTFEGKVLAAKDRTALKHIAVNAPQSLLPVGHVFLCTHAARPAVQAVSNQAHINARSPLIQWLTQHLRSRAKAALKSKSAAIAPGTFNLKSRRADDDFHYPYQFAFWAPFAPNARAGGLLFTRDTPWQEGELPVMIRAGQITGTAWAAHSRARRQPLSGRKKTVLWTAALASAAMLCIPVPVTTLAPAQITAKDPFIVAAPMDGVIDTVYVPPGRRVQKGALLAGMNDTQYRNEYQLAGEEKSLASAKLRQASLSSFIDETAKRDLAVARAEETLAGARQAYAKDRLARTQVRAPKSGLVIYDSARDWQDWTGKPVIMGEKILQIADPARVHIRIEAPLSDPSILQAGARLRLYLDADPLRALEGRLERAASFASPQDSGNMAYEAYGVLHKPDGAPPRIGGRGVVKIYGAKAPLGYWLARRPIVAVRQMTGL